MATVKSILQGGKENEILNFSPYFPVPLDTLISLPPSLLRPYRMFAWRKNELAKQKSSSD